MAKSVKYTTYRKKFETMVKKGVLVKGYKYDEYVEETVNLDDYKQCYKPSFKPREELPKYWFVSKEGFLINAKGNNLSFVKPNLGQDRPQFTISSKPKNKHISTYGLVGLVWGSYIEPDAYTLMQMNGLDCIGKNPKADENGKIKGKVQPHHTAAEGYLKEQTLENYIFNNRPEYIEFLTNRDHTIVGGLTGNPQKDMEKMRSVEYKYSDVPSDHIKVFAHTEIDMRTGLETKISRVLTTEEAQNMEYKVLSVYAVSEDAVKKLNHFSVKAKENKDAEAYRELPLDEKTGIQEYVKALFKSNRGLKEIEFRYKTISMIATRNI